MIDIKDCWLNKTCKKSCPDTFCIKLFKLDNLYNNALLTLAQRKHIALRIDEDGSDRQAFSALKKVEDDIENFIGRGDNLYIYSLRTGNGKTSWAIRLIQSYFNKIWYKSDLSCKALFINVPRFLIALKDNISNQDDHIAHIKQNILNCDLVVWDEVGVKSLTEYEHENLLILINARLDANKANIYTSNLDSEELKLKIGDRLYSRIINSSQCIEFVGADKRGVL